MKILNIYIIYIILQNFVYASNYIFNNLHTINILTFFYTSKTTLTLF